jgi:hypothetical protein
MGSAYLSWGDGKRHTPTHIGTHRAREGGGRSDGSAAIELPLLELQDCMGNWVMHVHTHTHTDKSGDGVLLPLT